MALIKFLLYAFTLALFQVSYGQQEFFDLLTVGINSSVPMRTCDQIAVAVSSASQVFFPCKYVILSVIRFMIFHSEWAFKLHLSTCSTCHMHPIQVRRCPFAR